VKEQAGFGAARYAAATNGGFSSFGANLTELYRRAADDAEMRV